MFIQYLWTDSPERIQGNYDFKDWSLQPLLDLAEYVPENIRLRQKKEAQFIWNNLINDKNLIKESMNLTFKYPRKKK